MSLLLIVSGWADAHPELFAAIVWPLVTALLTFLFKPRTAAEYLALPPRVAAFLRFLGAVGLDVPKAVESLKAIVGGGSRRPPGPPVVGVLVLIGALCCVPVVACTPFQRQVVRDVSHVVVDVLDCVLANEKKPDAQIVAMCAIGDVTSADVMRVIAAERAALAAAKREVGGVCAPDAGPPADAGTDGGL